MTSSDAGATSSSISSPTAPSPMPTLSPAPSLTLSPVSTTSDNLIHRPFAGALLSCSPTSASIASTIGFQEIDYGRRGKGYVIGAFQPALGPRSLPPTSAA